MTIRKTKPSERLSTSVSTMFFAHSCAGVYRPDSDVTVAVWHQLWNRAHGHLAEAALAQACQPVVIPGTRKVRLTPHPAMARPAVNCSGDFDVAQISIPSAAITSPNSLGTFSLLARMRCIWRYLQEQSSSKEIGVRASDEKTKSTSGGICRHIPV